MGTPSKRKPAAKLNMKNLNRKRKRRPSESDFSDLDNDHTPVKKEMDEDESKRRSGRNTGSRKKYVDELDLNLSDDNVAEKEDEGGVDGKQNVIFVDPNSEDT